MEGRWIDVFVTRPADDPSTRGQESVTRYVTDSSGTRREVVSAAGQAMGEEYKFDDVFCCSVQSVCFDPSAPNEAIVTSKDSDWILPTWTQEYMLATAATSPYADIQVGDLVRVGGVAHEGFTDYLTVLEKRVITKVINGTAEGLVTTLNSGKGTKTADMIGSGVTVTSAGIAHICLRLNVNLNATKLTGVTNNNTANSWTTRSSGPADVTLATRGHGYTYMSNPSTAYVGEDAASEQYYYPLYRSTNWMKGTELVARLDHGVKQVCALKLLGYQLVNKRQVGIHHAHEMQSDDFLILRIKEIEGHVISNNKFANGALAILRVGDSSNNVVGATEFSAYEPNGIVNVKVEQANSTIRNLTIQITDRKGDPAHFGRLHLWFKLLVSHG